MSEKRICSYCGNIIDDAEDICSSCGARVFKKLSSQRPERPEKRIYYQSPEIETKKNTGLIIGILAILLTIFNRNYYSISRIFILVLCIVTILKAISDKRNGNYSKFALILGIIGLIYNLMRMF